MKVILNKDLSSLGEEGDVKDVAKGYARNYLFPRGIALPYTPQIVKLFEARKAEIDAKKEQKRQDAMGLKERLESLELTIKLHAGPNGRLYGAVTTQTIADELDKQGFQIERKRIDLTGVSIKNVGKYKAIVKLYENSFAEIQFSIVGEEIKTEASKTPARLPRRRREGFASTATEASAETPLETAAEAPVEAPLAEAPAQTPVETSVEAPLAEVPAETPVETAFAETAAQAVVENDDTSTVPA